MTSLFTFPGDAGANLIFQKLTTTAATVIGLGRTTGNGGGRSVAYIRCSEIAGGTPNLTVELYDVANTTSYYLGSGGVTYIAKALTAKQSVLFDDGIPVPTGWQLRVTASVANQVDVVGAYVSPTTASKTWTGPAR